MAITKEKIKKLKDANLTGQIEELAQIMEILRDANYGCPWDKEQDHLSIRSYLIEESYEAVEAIESQNDVDIKNELGDVLLQVVFHSQLAKERGSFELKDVVIAVSEKMLRRHPHVFGDVTANNSTQVLENWEKIKAKEKESENTGKPKETFSESLRRIPNSLPSLLKAERIGEKSARVQFDWLEIQGVINKVEEELNEIKQAVAHAFKDTSQIKKPLTQDKSNFNSKPINELGTEIGDCIFSLAQLARWLGFSAEDLTRECCNRFIDRLKVIETEFKADLAELQPEEKSIMWAKAKEFLKR